MACWVFRAAYGGESGGANWLLAVRRSDKVSVPAWRNGPIRLLPFVQPAFAVRMKTLLYCNPSVMAPLLCFSLRLTYCTACFHSGKLATKGLRLTWIGFADTQPRREFEAITETLLRRALATPDRIGSSCPAVLCRFLAIGHVLGCLASGSLRYLSGSQSRPSAVHLS